MQKFIPYILPIIFYLFFLAHYSKSNHYDPDYEGCMSYYQRIETLCHISSHDQYRIIIEPIFSNKAYIIEENYPTIDLPIAKKCYWNGAMVPVFIDPCVHYPSGIISIILVYTSIILIPAWIFELLS